MIIALLALAFAMIFGGLLAAFFGWDIVLIERGWTMVLAGIFSAACGALLLGVTAVVAKLAQIQSELARLQITLDEEVREEASLSPSTGTSSSSGLSVAALAGGMLGGRLFGRGEEKGKDEDEETPADLPLFPDEDRRDEPAEDDRELNDLPEEAPKSAPILPFPSRPTSEEHADELRSKVPDFLLAERRTELSVEVDGPRVETSLFEDEPKLDRPQLDEPEDHPVELDRSDIHEPVSETAELHEHEPEPELEPEPEPVIVEEEAAASHEPEHEESVVEEADAAGRTVIGTYNSGDNTYVMFSDGSIEAQTPKGVFHFKSLDELKAFIASGGEGKSAAT